MTSYFDAAERRLVVDNSADPGDHGTDAAFLARLNAVESDVVRDVNLITGDREFPDDLREWMQSVIALFQVSLDPAGRTEHACMFRASVMLVRLHSLFHTLGSRRVVVRFGRLDDKPDGILALRDDCDRTSLYQGSWYRHSP